MPDILNNNILSFLVILLWEQLSFRTVSKKYMFLLLRNIVDRSSAAVGCFSQSKSQISKSSKEVDKNKKGIGNLTFGWVFRRRRRDAHLQEPQWGLDAPEAVEAAHRLWRPEAHLRPLPDLHSPGEAVLREEAQLDRGRPGPHEHVLRREEGAWIW